MTCRVVARAPARLEPLRPETDAAVVEAVLHDAARVPGGHAAGVVAPDSTAAVSALLASGVPLLPIGAQSSLTGGATPRGEVVITTRRLGGVRLLPSGAVEAGAGVPLAELQRHLQAGGRYYPPVPTYDGAFVGGTIATNAAGAATFKYGSTRDWVEAITVVLPGGDVLELARGQARAEQGAFELVRGDGRVVRVPVPTYRMPAVAKLSAGYFASPGMDLVDLFVGSEGTLGVVVSATLRTIPRPARALALLVCPGEAAALAATADLRRDARDAWRGAGPLDVAAVEYIDAASIDLVGDDVFLRTAVPRPPSGAVLLLVQLELHEASDAALERLAALTAAHAPAHDPTVALPGDERGAARLLALREAIPAAVNARVAAAQCSDPGVEKTACDMVVPFDRLAESLACYRHAFSSRGLPYAIWGHLSDGNLHPNVLPRSVEDVRLGREAILEIGRAIMRMGGAPLAEHGVGRSAIKQALLRDLYGDAGIAEMQAVKRALDPAWTLAPGVLFPRPGAGETG